MLTALHGVLFVVLAAAPPPASDTYQLPPQDFIDMVDAPSTPALIASPAADLGLLAEFAPYLAIADLAQPELKLAGHRFNPQLWDRTRASYARTLEILTIADGARRPVAGLPKAPRIRNLSWSPDGKRFAFTLSTDRGVELWLGDAGTVSANRLGTFHLNGVSASVPFQWLSTSDGLIVRLVPEGARPREISRLPRGPNVQETAGRKAATRTYQDLLKSPEDADTFEHYMLSRVVRVDLKGAATPIVDGPVVRAEPSPDARFVLVETLHRPFSYMVPDNRFPRRIEIWSAAGQRVREIADLPLADAVPVDFDAVREGPRSMGWRSDRDATLTWVEAQDKGDPRRAADVRDRLFALAAPFEGAPVVVADLALRYGGTSWSGDDLALVTESWWKTRKTRTWRIQPGTPAAKPQLVWDRSFEDRYGDPGDPVFERTPRGTWVLQRSPDGKRIYLFGDGASPEGDRPFVDALDLGTLKAARLWRSEAPYYENPVRILDDEGRRVLTRRESPSEPPNYFVRDVPRGARTAVTRFPHPMPRIAQAKKELIHYTRPDGVKLSATLYLPAGYDAAKDGPLPTLMWAYPDEFKSTDAASQVRDSPYRFIRVTPGSPLFWLVRGYAVVDDPSLPIVGEGDQEPNDTYVEQLVAGAKAVVDEIVRRGVSDRERIAVGGHSYGAFMTANLLAHSDLFRAGIARSGAYNRTLTPFSFQSEERSFWEAPETYMKVSPFTYAQKINEPVLLIHGAEDNNPGTFPIQSERLYQALTGLGGHARLVMLPYEAHGYSARESLLHMLWEMDRWLEQHVGKQTQVSTN